MRPEGWGAPRTQPGGQPALHVGRRKDPNETNGNRNDTNCNGVEQQLSPGDRSKSLQDDARLQAGQEENGAFNYVGDEIPEKYRLQPRLRAYELYALGSDVQTGNHSGQNPRASCGVWNPERKERRQQR